MIPTIAYLDQSIAALDWLVSPKCTLTLRDIKTELRHILSRLADARVAADQPADRVDDPLMHEGEEPT